MTPYLADGSYGRSWVVTPGQNTFNNLLSCKDGENNYKQTRIVGSAFAEYIFLMISNTTLHWESEK